MASARVFPTSTRRPPLFRLRSEEGEVGVPGRSRATSTPKGSRARNWEWGGLIWGGGGRLFPRGAGRRLFLRRGGGEGRGGLRVSWRPGSALGGWGWRPGWWSFFGGGTAGSWAPACTRAVRLASELVAA